MDIHNKLGGHKIFSQHHTVQHWVSAEQHRFKLHQTYDMYEIKKNMPFWLVHTSSGSSRSNFICDTLSGNNYKLVSDDIWHQL